MRQLVVQFVALFLTTASALAGGGFPKQPDPNLTPGSYCTNPDSRRYKEKIAYCERDVDPSEKWQIINDYNQKLGFHITAKQRPNFKIDHLIPLCAGGSNSPNNLWPQHVSVYELTDPVEHAACERLADGAITQKQAVELIFRAKYHLDQADEVLDYLRGL